MNMYNIIMYNIILQSKIESGEYVLGDTIVPQTYKKVVLTEDGTIKTEFFTVSGRKIPLSDIRERILACERILMRTRTNEDYAVMTQQQVQDRIAQLGESNNCSETARLNGLKDYLKLIEQTRHLMIWADNSTLPVIDCECSV